MAERKIVTRISISGEEKYKQAISNVNSSLKQHKSELTKLKEQYKESQNSTEYLAKKSEALGKTQQAQAEKVKVLRDALKNAKDAYSEYAQKTDTAAKAVDEQREKLERLKNTLGEESNEYKEASTQLDQYEEELRQASEAQELCGSAVSSWQSKLNTAETQQARTNAQIKTNNQYLNEARNSADGCATSIDQFGKKTKEAANEVDKSNSSLKDTSSAISGLTNAVIASGIKESFEKISEAIKQCIESAEEYESSIAKLQTISGESSIGTLSEDIMELSNATGIAASDLANTAYNAISAGTAVSDAVGMAESASKLAIAGFTDTDSALSVLTTAINAYGDAAGTATEISDSLIQVQNLGVTTVADLAANMGKAIATASAYSVNLSNLEAAYISTTKSGINTAESTTYISSMLKELGDSGTDVAKVIQEKTGKSFGQLMSSGESLGNVLQILLESCNGDSEALMNLWSSAEAGKASNAILNQGIETFNKNLQTVQSSAGATESAYETMADTAEMAGKRASNAFENLKVAVGEQLTPVVTEAQSAFADMTEGVTEFVTENPQVVTAIEAVAAGLGVMAAGVVAVNTAVNVLLPLLQSLMATMEANPVGLLVTAVAGLSAAFIVLAANTQEEEGALTDYRNAASEAKEATNNLNESLGTAKTTFSEAAGEAQGTADQAGNLVDRLNELSSKSNKTNTEIEEMSGIVGQLNTLYPELGLEINSATGELNKTNTELEHYVTNAKNVAMETAYSDKLTEESKALVEAQTSLTEAQDKLATANQEYNSLLSQQKSLVEAQSAAVDKENAAYQKYSDVLSDTEATTEEIQAAELAYNEAKNDSVNATEELQEFQEKYSETLREGAEEQENAQEAIDSANESLEEAQEAVDATSQAYEDYKFKLTDVGDACQDTFDTTMEMLDGMDQTSGQYEALKGSIQEVTNAYVEQKDSLQTVYDETSTALENLKAEQEETTASILSNLESQVGGLDAVSTETQYTAEQLIDNFKSQADYLNTYLSNVESLTQNNAITMTDSFREFLTSGSEDAVQVAAAMSQAIAEGHTDVAQEVANSYSTVQDTLNQTASGAADAQKNYSSQIETMEKKLTDCVQKMDQSDKAYNNALKTFQGAVRAATNQAGPYNTVYSNAATTSVNALNKSGQATSYAANNIRGAIIGAQSLAGDYVAVYRNMANAAIAEMQRVDQQKSPSRRYKKHGRYNVQGAILGVKELSKDYVQAYSDMATEAIEAYNSQMEELAPIAQEASESIFGSTGTNIEVSSESASSAINALGNAMNSGNKVTTNKLDKVVELLERYLPEAGTTYLDGTLVSKTLNNSLTKLQNTTAKRRSAMQGIR